MGQRTCPAAASFDGASVLEGPEPPDSNVGSSKQVAIYRSSSLMLGLDPFRPHSILHRSVHIYVYV